MHNKTPGTTSFREFYVVLNAEVQLCFGYQLLQIALHFFQTAAHDLHGAIVGVLRQLQLAVSKAECSLPICDSRIQGGTS